MISRRQFLKLSTAAGVGVALPWRLGISPVRVLAQLPGGSLDPTTIPKFQDPLVILPTMPPARTIPASGNQQISYYEVAARQFQQQVLPAGMPQTTVWGYGSARHPGTLARGGSFHYPALTFETLHNQPIRVKWINDLVDANGSYRPSLFAVDQTLHWANPPGPRDGHGTSQEPYTGPVPLVTHLHGSHSDQESDGYPEAWTLPAARDIPPGYSTTGTYYDLFKASSGLGSQWEPGCSVYEYPNDQQQVQNRHYAPSTIIAQRQTEAKTGKLSSTLYAVGM